MLEIENSKDHQGITGHIAVYESWKFGAAVLIPWDTKSDRQNER
jgi:hypothetical protein